MSANDWKNKLYYGDNLDIMREHIADESVDLIYLDPPFNSKATYNVLFGDEEGTQSDAQITAFEDTWKWVSESDTTAITYNELLKNSPHKLSNLIESLYNFLGQSDMMAYLVMMAIRLVEMHRVLKQTGSVYLHCDPTASHYLKLLLDAIFGFKYFKNEIVWKRRYAHSDSGRYGNVMDIIFFYTKSDNYTWNQVYQKYDQGYIDTYYRYKDDDGRRWLSRSTTAPGGRGPIYEWKGITRAWRYTEENMGKLDQQGKLYYTKNGMPRYKQYLDEMPGSIAQNIWTDIGPMNSWMDEALGYPTQKPEALLERIIKGSSNEGDIVLDPFCGCGTTVAVAERLDRKWIGIDITHLAITVMKKRLEDAFTDKKINDLNPYEVIGEPKNLSGAKALAKQDKYQFEWWALGKVEARPAQDKKKGADKGIDGILKFIDDNSGKAKIIVLQVKSGKVQRNVISTLNSDRNREKAEIGVLITLVKPTPAMIKEASATGFYEPELFPGRAYPKIQILTIEEILNGKQIQYPRVAPEVTFRQAKRQSKDDGIKQETLF